MQFIPALILLCMDILFTPCPNSADCICVAVFLDSLLFCWTVCLSCQYHIVFNYLSFTIALKSFNINLPVLFFSELFCVSIQILESACQHIPKILRFLLGLIWTHRINWGELNSSLTTLNLLVHEHSTSPIKLFSSDFNVL